MDVKMFKKLNILFNQSYYIAKNNKPFSDTESLAVLIGELDLNLQHNYINRNACSKFISCLATVIREKVGKEIEQAQFISLLLDASTDKCTIEELIVYVRYI